MGDKKVDRVVCVLKDMVRERSYQHNVLRSESHSVSRLLFRLDSHSYAVSNVVKLDVRQTTSALCVEVWITIF